MAKTDLKSVDEYLATLSRDRAAVLRSVRQAIKKALPGAEETISYQIPTYRVAGRPVLYVAAWKEHYSLYPATARVRAALQDDLARYEVEKGTIRFPLRGRVPTRLIGRIAKVRAAEESERASLRRPSARKRA